MSEEGKPPAIESQNDAADPADPAGKDGEGPAPTGTRQLAEDIKLITQLASTLPTFWSIDNVAEESNNPTGDYRSGATNTILVELSRGFEDAKKGYSTERDRQKLVEFEQKLMLPLVGIKLKVDIVD